MPFVVPAPERTVGNFESGVEGVKGLADLLLQAVLSGQLGAVPQGRVAPTGNIHDLQLSGGRQFSGTPGAAQRLIPRDIQGFQNQVNRGVLPSESLPPGLGFTPTGKSQVRFKPSLERQLKQSEITKNAAQAKMLGSVGTVGSITLPDGTSIPTLASSSGPKPLNTGEAAKASLSERSYEHHSKIIETAQKPIDEGLTRLLRLQDTVNAMTPQADALVAPELLTVMAGGQGSGLRMNEAEIARIIGGRTNLEGLKAAVNKFQLDPRKGFSITPAQREQIRTLVNTVEQKLTTKREILNNARQQLIEASSPEEYKKVLFQMNKTLQESDGSGGQPSGIVTPAPLSPSAQSLVDRYRGK